ncbi:hypothetical protein SNOG_10834 [Parastagonospora nodorum SN15]|uniref:Uncharacterized protein n=1 Tax=Phaeosphaeria nodorum (strain SN15 / ATCC MYA-4574 / FGSC 10173) TaxID=321614 RepID=Q0UBN0_PHANO|nr:hypothetical protein SNOG_10834 [Parastagonospora nodorum SN15]EAT82228.1 hypothetical protein SNOG_10834 [Parastagonospora nodorum SN15]
MAEDAHAITFPPIFCIGEKEAEQKPAVGRRYCRESSWGGQPAEPGKTVLAPDKVPFQNPKGYG